LGNHCRTYLCARHIGADGFDDSEEGSTAVNRIIDDEDILCILHWRKYEGRRLFRALFVFKPTRFGYPKKVEDWSREQAYYFFYRGTFGLGGWPLQCYGLVSHIGEHIFSNIQPPRTY